MEFYSDCDSIRTEDFASKFCEYVAADTCKDSGFSCEKSEQCVTPIPKDEQYSEIIARMRSKQDYPSPKDEIYQSKNETRLSPTKLYYNQNLDLESIATELFENQLQKYQDLQTLSGRSAPTDSSNASLHLGNLANVQPIRRDIMNKFLSKYTLEESKLATEIKYQPIDDQRKHGHLSSDNVKRANSRKEVNWKSEFNRQSDPQSKNVNSLFRSNSDLACDIRKKSLRIQNEIQEERKRKLESIHENQAAREQTPREQLDIKVKELDQLTDRMRKARADREKISEEMDSLRNKLRNKSSEYRSGETQKCGKSILNECNTFAIMDSSPQMQSSNDQLTRLNTQLNEKKSYLKDLEDRIRQRLCEIQDLESVGLSKQEIHQVIEERNGLYELLRLSEENENDRYELAKKLTETKEELSLEHKRSREKIIKLEEELDNSFKKISCLYEERERTSKELLHYKDIIQKQQDDVSELYIERNELRRQLDKYKEEIDTERSASRDMLEQEKKRYECHFATEEAQTKMIINDYKSQLSSLQMENNCNVEKGLTLKSKVSQLEIECQKLRNDLEHQENEFKEGIERIVEEKNQAIEKFRKEFYIKKENEIQTIKFELDSEQMRTIDSLKECYKQQNVDLQIRLENKSQEVQDLKSDIRRMKQDFSDRESNIKSQYETVIMKLKEESKRIIENCDKRRYSEIEECKEKYEGLMKKMNREIEEERSMNERLKINLEKSNKDLIQESDLARKLKNDKTTIISKLKVSAKEKLQEEQKNIKEFYEKELEDQLKIIEQKMQEKNSQILAKSKEIKSLETENIEIKNAFASNLNVFFDAIHYQCSQMANEGKFIVPSFKNIKFNDSMDVNQVVQMIIKNFQICCQEYSQFYNDFVDKIKEDKDTSVKLMEEKYSRDIQAIKEQIMKEQADELNVLNTHHRQEMSLFQKTHQEEIERLRRNVKDWKQKTADRLAQKLQKEFHKEFEKKSSKRVGNKHASLSLHSFKGDQTPSTVKPIGLIEDLRSNIRQLRDENLSLRKVIVGQNISHSSLVDEKRDSDYSGHNGSTSRPQSVGRDAYRNRQSSMEDSFTKSCSYKVTKE